MYLTELSLIVLVSLLKPFSLQSSEIQQITKCKTNCPPIVEEVCGSDNKTYTNICFLGKSACEQKANIALEYTGPCDCPRNCTGTYKPICGINRTTGVEKTYPNKCHFKKTVCEMKAKKHTIELKKKGPCKKWEKKKRGCPKKCMDIFAPICGDDKITYANICSLKMVNCKREKGKETKIKQIGRCQHKAKLCPDFCPFNLRETCGNDLNLHPNECEMKLAACRHGIVIKKLRKKDKKERRLCEKIRRKCLKYCPPEEIHICGTDNQTYLNECVLRQKNCMKGKRVKVAYLGKCVDKKSRIRLNKPKLSKPFH